MNTLAPGTPNLGTPNLGTSDPDAADRHALASHKMGATLLLVLMAALMVASYLLPGSWLAPEGWPRGLLEAASKAGLIGGIADWFAVTALFRHPLGIPIPHTAILPRQKERLGRALGRFVANHVVTANEVSAVMSRLDLPGILHRFLADPAAARPLAATLAASLPRLLATIEDGRARRLAARLLPRLLGGPAAGRLAARALHGLVEGGQHQEVFGFIMGQVRVLLAGREDALRAAIEERVREQGGRLVGWALGASIARRVLAMVNAELDKMSPDGSELRAAFDEWVRREVTRMEEDPARAAELGLAIRRVIAHETIQAWVWDVWARLRLALEADAALPSGRTVAFFEGALGNLGAMLESDAGSRERLQVASAAMVGAFLPSIRTRLADFIARVVGGWDAATLTDRLELRVGKDLQFVRVNGTLVGFLLGGVLYALLHAAFGTVGF